MLSIASSLDQIVTVLLIFVLFQISSISTGAFSLPHILLNNLQLMFPSIASLTKLQPKTHKRQKAGAGAGASSSKQITVKDRLDAIDFETERVHQGQFVTFPGYDVYDNLVMFSLACVIAHAINEGWRLGKLFYATSVDKDVDGLLYLDLARSWTTFEEFQSDAGTCGLSSQLSAREATANSRNVLQLVHAFIFGAIVYSVYASWSLMLSGPKKKGSFVTGAFFSFLTWSYMVTPSLERLCGLSLSQVAEDISIRMVLFSRLFSSTSAYSSEWSEDGTQLTSVMVIICITVFTITSSFDHSLRQLAKNSAVIVNKIGRMKVLKVRIMFISLMPVVIIGTYFFNNIILRFAGLYASTFRQILCVIWIANTLLLVQPLLQSFVEQAVQDSASSLTAHTINPAMVRQFYYNRVTLVVYSATQMLCFSLFLMIVVIGGWSKGGGGLVGGVGAYNFEQYSNVGEVGLVLKRSDGYDSLQRFGNIGSFSSFSRLCPVLPVGAYPSDESEEESVAEKEKWNASSFWTTNKNSASHTLSGLWMNKDLQEGMSGNGGFVKAILYNSENFDENQLANKNDMGKAKKLKAHVRELKKILHGITFHTFISPNSYLVLSEFCVILGCFLWAFSFGGGLLEEIKGDNSRLMFDFEMMDVEEVEGERSKIKVA